MDVQMPEMDGFQATAEIRRREAGTGRRQPIIAMTAHALKGDRERCLEAGMDDYVSKPIRAQELWDALGRVLPREAGEPAAPAAVKATAPADGGAVLDAAQALARVEGNKELLRDLVHMYYDDCPKLLTEIREAVAAGDAKKLEKAAHTIKGMVGIFHAQPAFEAALALEKQGKAGDLGTAAEGQARLVKELDRLRPALEALTAE
jgi:CheY-like chemotaxis protein